MNFSTFPLSPTWLIFIKKLFQQARFPIPEKEDVVSEHVSAWISRIFAFASAVK
jgi:hypothetical protein